MSLLLELLPVIAFFISYKLSDLYVATTIMMVATALQLLAIRLKNKSLTEMQLLNGILVTTLGTATLLFQNPWFIKCKPTLLYWGLAIACILSAYLDQYPLTHRLLGSVIKLPTATWLSLNRGWIVFFSGLGCLNLVVAYTTDTIIWMYFKLFGLLSITFLFILLQAAYFYRKNHVK